ncbi:MAG: hypothetical protein HQL68_05000 [Magnetococcales bacterium]|nr:hypothetical protein [Magnetococcales bacterium]
MNFKSLSLAGLACLSMVCVQNASAADDMFSEYAVTGELSTRGLGLNATTNITSQLNGRLSLAGFTYSMDQDLDDISYESDLTLMTVGGLVDWHPFSGGLRLSTGLFLNFNGIEASATPASTSSYTFNNVSYNGSLIDSVSADIEFNTVAPYVGIGWGNPVQKDSNWFFHSDVGVLFTGKPSVSLSASTNSANILTSVSNDATAAATLTSEINSNVAAAQADIEDDDALTYFQYYPVISLGLSYRF